MMMMPLRGPEPGRLLLAVLLARLPERTLLVAQDRTPWASATFVGTRHHVRLSCPDPDAAARLAATIADADMPLRGHLLADVEARVEADQLIVDALTLVAA
jgi:hypothetical protein